MKCQDKSTQDSQSHVLQCKVLLPELNVGKLRKTNSVRYEDMFDSLEKQRELAVVLTSQGGTTGGEPTCGPTGPDSAVNL